MEDHRVGILCDLTISLIGHGTRIAVAACHSNRIVETHCRGQRRQLLVS